MLFDDPNLVADAGLVPVMRLAKRGRLPDLVRETVRIDGAGNSGGANPAAKVTSPLAAMCAGADSIEDTDRLRHGAIAFIDVDSTTSASSAPPRKVPRSAGSKGYARCTRCWPPSAPRPPGR
ncbi:hypothetical protein [Streptomyces violaceusniger]|uniref:hypothetical protein n=1 Tax=Streptomyces violaceusniger TaxID=68280 RepID=UPI0010F5E3C5